MVDEDRNEPEEEMAESKDEQYEEIDPKDISRCVMVGLMMMLITFSAILLTSGSFAKQEGT